ncbi:MAG: ABC transporter ATP-binding protein [Anaerolineae bacterium]|jgi:ATP-binding cassette, subfamily B, multidrug efflux pump|nr:ABC transporter ATP-binding protein [Anaerolineae bacterium]MBT7072696.1 ABC transporter ATP-binding protein [Anaerolineae bacterium]MBT7324511.1 ABC transporter ATP-binding protein [Anaerolineae bacterium]
MLRLAKYLKPYTALLVATVILLFAQANLDLALPDYLSRIVNNGIQQGGVENAVPLAIRATEMDKVTVFMSADDKTDALDHYTLIDTDSPEVATYVEIYPALAEEAVYVLNEDVSNAEIERLIPVFAKPLLTVSSIEMAIADPEMAAQMGGGDIGFDITQLPAGMDVFTMLGQLPDAQKAQITEKIDAQFDALGESMVAQSAVASLKSEYEALGMDTAELQNDYILRMGGIMLLLTLLSGAATIAVGFTSSRTAAGLARDLRHDLFRKVENFSSAEFNKFSTASLITRSTNDITQLQTVTVMIIRMIVYAPILAVGGIIRVIGRDASMTWLIGVAVIFLVGMIITVFSTALPKFKLIQKLTDRLNLVSREQLSGMMVIRAFNMQPFEEERFDKANIDLTANSLFINRLMVVMMPMMMLIMNVLSLAIIWVGAHRVAEAAMQVGDMMAFMQYAMQIVMAFLFMSMMFIMVPRASVSGERIADVLDTELSITDPAEPRALPADFRGEVEFRNVSFHYPDADADVLHDVSFTAKPGQTTAFIGSTGSGKSTVINLLPRFYDVNEGTILVDGVDIREVTQHDLREKIGYVPQKGVLFSGTIESNLRYADENATEEMLASAINIAQVTEFVSGKEEGIQAEISQGGTNVSGGQKQRLSIARALVNTPPIYIFDDSFSALDFKTEAALRKELKEKTGDSTVLVVTQRVASVMHAEQIIVLEQGRVVGKGTHEELMKSSETYIEIAVSQLSMEELS